MSWIAVAIGGAAVANVGGALISSNANSKAADKASAAQLQGGQIQADSLREAQDKQLAFAREGQATLDAARKENAPAQNYLRGIVAGDGSLTPLQQQQLEEAQRQTRNQISTSSIAGSGRTAAALLAKTEATFRNQALDSNRQQAISAATGLSGQAGAETLGIGNISVGTGTQQAQLQAQQGQALGNATTNAGTIQAQGDLANGKILGGAIGDIGSAVATANRASRYGDTATRLGSISLGNTGGTGAGLGGLY